MGKHLKDRNKEKAGILSSLLRQCEYAKTTGLPHEILCGREVRKFLERITGGKGSFMRFHYSQEEGADPLMVRVKKLPRKEAP